jgi:hypothetical protein
MNCLSLIGMGRMCKEAFFQTEAEYAEEVKSSELLHHLLYDEIWESIEASSVVLEAAIIEVENEIN